MAQHIFDSSDQPLFHRPLRLLNERFVMPAIWNNQMNVPFRREMDQLPCVARPESHGLLAHHVESPGQGCPGMFIMQIMWRGDDDAVEVLLKDIPVVFRSKKEVEPFLNCLELIAPEAADRHEIDVIP